jgi:hypothetical protein
MAKTSREKNPKSISIDPATGRLGHPFERMEGKAVSGWVIKKHDDYEGVAILTFGEKGSSGSRSLTIVEDIVEASPGRRSGRSRGAKRRAAARGDVSGKVAPCLWTFTLYGPSLSVIGRTRRKAKSIDDAIIKGIHWGSGREIMEAAARNPARAISLEAEIAKSRQRRARGAAGRATNERGAASSAASASLRRRLAKVNPDRYLDDIPRMSDADLRREHSAVQDLIALTAGHPEASPTAVKDLKYMRMAIVAEEKRRYPTALGNPRKKAEKVSKNTTRKKAKKAAKKMDRKSKPGWKILIDRCEKLWTAYCEKPTKRNLGLVFDHLAQMKASTKYESSKRVRDERAKCLRSANAEAKRLGMR